VTQKRKTNAIEAEENAKSVQGGELTNLRQWEKMHVLCDVSKGFGNLEHLWR
jgi:hypothetical protein